MASGPKRHHQVPKFYLERFSSNGKVAVRRRDGKAFETDPINVAVESGYYDIPDGMGGVSKEVEEGLANIEGMADEVLRKVDASGHPPSERDTDSATLALFVGLQMARTTEHRERVMFPRRVIEWAAGRPITQDVVAEYLETEYLGFKPSPREVDGAFTIVTVANTDERHTLSDEFGVEMMLRAAIELSRRLLGFTWSVEHARKSEFITSDTPALIWRPRSWRDEFQGFGIEYADEVRFPLDPIKQLVFTRDARPERLDVRLQRVASCNDDMADASHRFIVGRPSNAAFNALPLERWRPLSRFNVGPLLNPDGTPHPEGGEVLHMWRQRGASIGRRRRTPTSLMS